MLPRRPRIEGQGYGVATPRKDKMSALCIAFDDAVAEIQRLVAARAVIDERIRHLQAAIGSLTAVANQPAEPIYPVRSYEGLTPEVMREIKAETRKQQLRQKAQLEGESAEEKPLVNSFVPKENP